MTIVLPRAARAHVIVIGLTALLIALGVLMSDAFATRGNFANLLEQSVAVGLVAIGQTVVVLAGGIDLGVGALVSALGVLFALLADRFPEQAHWLLLATLAAGALIGAVNAAFVVALRLHSLVVTIGMAALLGGLTLMAAPQPSGSVPTWVQDIAYGQVEGLSGAGLGMLGCFAAVGWWLRRTRSGLHLIAAGGNTEGARLVGLSPARANFAAFTLCGLTCGLAAVVLVARTGTGDPLAGDPLTLASITPVVIGGTALGGGRGGVLGTLLGVFLLSLLGNLLNYLGVSTFLQWTVQGFIIIAAVFFQVGQKELKP